MEGCVDLAIAARVCSPCPRLYLHRNGFRSKQLPAPQPCMLPLNHCDLQRHVGVSNLPKARYTLPVSTARGHGLVYVRAYGCYSTARGGRESNSPASTCESNALTSRPLNYPQIVGNEYLGASPLEPSRGLSLCTLWSLFTFSRLNHCQCRVRAIDWDNAAAA